MPFSIFELFKIGVGPSSSHTMGPMTAACRFVRHLEAAGMLASKTRVTVALYASLALTGRGHATDTAVIVGLHGIDPESVDPDDTAKLLRHVRDQEVLTLAGHRPIRFSEHDDLLWHGGDELAFHPNGLQFTAYGGDGDVLCGRTYFSIGGGFVLDEEDVGAVPIEDSAFREPYPYRNAAELLAIAAEHGLSIAQVALANEDAPPSRGYDGRGRTDPRLDGAVHRARPSGDRRIARRSEGKAPSEPAAR